MSGIDTQEPGDQQPRSGQQEPKPSKLDLIAGAAGRHAENSNNATAFWTSVGAGQEAALRADRDGSSMELPPGHGMQRPMRPKK